MHLSVDNFKASMIKQGFQQAYNATADFQLLTLIYLWQTAELISSHPWTLNLTTRLFFLFFFLPDEESVTTRINYKDDFTINFFNFYNLLGINHLVNSDGNNGHILMSVLFDI